MLLKYYISLFSALPEMRTFSRDTLYKFGLFEQLDD